MGRVVRLLVGLISLPLFLCEATPSFAGPPLLTLTYNLEQMAAAADRIFVGKVIDAREDYIQAAGGDLPVTVYTFEVEEALKASIGGILTIQQVGHRSDFLGQTMPHYEVGTTVMLFLHADSQYGLTSPVGLGQGAFLVKTEGPVKVSVTNGWGNRGLLERSARIDALLQAEPPQVAHALKAAKRSLPYEAFRNLVLKLIQP